MTIQTVNVATLKKAKNTVIGSPTAKLALAQDEVFVATLVNCLNAHEPPDGSTGRLDDIRIEAAQVLSSLSYGSPEALKRVLNAQAHQALLYAILHFQPSDPAPLKSAFARSLRALAVACAEIAGPSQWGLKDSSTIVREEAQKALDSLFQRDRLDIYLPLLADPSPQTSVSIAQLLGSTLRTPSYRTAVAEWIPPAERGKEPRTPRRGWEKRDTTSVGARQGGWVARSLTTLVCSKDAKLQEAALSALAALAQENYDMASTLAKPSVNAYGVESPSALSLALGLCKSRFTEVQLAASLCSTHILRATSSNLPHPIPPDHASSLIILHAMNRLISSNAESAITRTKACFIFTFLIMDEKELCQAAFDRGSLNKLATLVQSITPTEPTAEWDQDEAVDVSNLREAALTTISVMAIADNDIRREITDTVKLIPQLVAALSHRHRGVRYAACQCVRALGRSVAVARTSLVDSGLGNSLFKTFAKEDEDRLVTYAALTAMCNLITEYSPLRQPFLEQGLVKRLAQLMGSGHAELRLNALWAVKNLVYKCNSTIKRGIMKEIGWKELDKLLVDTDPGVREQALYIIRNFADSEEDVEVVFLELGSDHLLNLLASALESKDSDVLLQAAYALSNLANGSLDHQDQILAHTRLLKAVRACLVDAPMEVRRAAVSCVLELARDGDKHTELHEAGIVSTLRHVCDYTGAMTASTTPGQHGVEREVKEKARRAMSFIEFGGERGAVE
ncbi:ARM repeat-containing protein [Amylostereum chailletii]|nr:ARM repeat-containing protein [Amylostereum chailletii]